MGLSGTKVAAELVLHSNVSKTLREAALEFDVFQRALKTVAERAKEIGTTLTTRVTLPIAGAGASVLKAAIDWESAFANVKKTAKGVADEFGGLTTRGKALEENIRAMSRELPHSAEELSAIAAAAGQFGISTDNIEGFTRVMADLGVATELSSMQAATGLSRIATITGMNQQNFDRLGSVLNELETQFNAGADEIVEYGLRIAGTGKTAGMAEKDFLAIGSAAASVGIQAEAGGTALSKTFQTIFEAVKTGSGDLKVFATTAGMTDVEFQKAFGEDAAATTIKFIEGLGRIQKEGGNVFQVMRDVEFQDSRLKNAMLALSGAGDQMRKQLEASRGAWEANNSLTREAALRYATTESQLKRLWNIWKDIARDLGSVLNPALTLMVKLFGMIATPIAAVARVFASLPDPIKLIVSGFVLMLASIGPIILALGFAVQWVVATAKAMLMLQLILVVLRGDVTHLTGTLGMVTQALKGTQIGAVAASWTGLATAAGTVRSAVIGVIAPYLTWGGAMLGLKTAASALWTVLSGWVGTLSTLVQWVLSLVGWKVKLALIIGGLLLQIPGMTGFLKDLGAILVDVVIIAWKFLVAVLGDLWQLLKDVGGAIVTFVGKLLSSIPGANAVAAAWEWLTGKVHGYRLAMDQAAKGPDFKTVVGDLPALPGAPTPNLGPMRQGVFTPKPIDNLEWLARDLGYVGDAADRASMQAVVLMSWYQKAVAEAGKLSPHVVGLFKAAKEAGAGEKELNEILIQAGVAAEYAGAAQKVLTDRIDEGNRKHDEAVQKAEAHREKLRELARDMNGLSAIAASKDMLDALKQSGVTRVGVEAMAPEAKKSVNDAALAGIAGIDTQVRLGTATAAMKAMRTELAAIEVASRDLTEGFHVLFETGVDGVTRLVFKGAEYDKLVKEQAENTRKWAEDLAKVGQVDLDTLFKDMNANFEATKALKIETRDLWIAANDSGVDTLQKRLAAVTRSYQDQRAAVTKLHKDAIGGAARMAELSEQEVAARAKVTTEYINALPPTKALLIQRKQEELQAIRNTKATLTNALAIGVLTQREKELLKEIDALNSKSAQLAKAFDRISKDLGTAGQAVGEFATYFEGSMNRVLAKTAEVLTELAQLGQGLAQIAAGDYVGGVANLILGALKLFDVGETEYEKQAKAAGVSFHDLRKEMVKTYGDYTRIQQAARRAGMDGLVIDFDPRGDAFQQLERLTREAEQLEAALAKIKKGLETFSTGAKTRIEAFVGAFKVGTDGKEVSLAAGLAKLGGTRTQVEAEYQRLGNYAGAAFMQTLREEGIHRALEVAGPLFDTLSTLGDKVGLGLHGAAKEIEDFYRTAKDNADVLMALEGIGQMVQGASDAMFLNQGLMDAFAEDTALQYDRLIGRGVDANTAMALMQPTLQSLWEAQQKFGLVTDGTTQALIDQAVAQGIVGENQRDVNQQILDVLKAIATVLGAEIPGAFGAMTTAAEEASSDIQDALNGIRDREVQVNVRYNDDGGGRARGEDPAPDPGDYAGGDSYDPSTQAMGGFVRNMNYCATGGFIRPLLRSGGGAIDWTPRGTDTVPTMLTPGELVLNVAQQRNVGAALGNDPKALASAIAAALKEGGIGGGEAGVVVLQSNGKPGDQFNAVLDSLPRALRQNKNGLRTALREALGIDA